jgi:aminoglycoside phosphotransferase (APT) family kinase protein
MHPRSTIYYWKCDRAAAFHGTAERDRARTGLEGQLTDELRQTFPGCEVAVTPVATQGNHLTFTARIDHDVRFVRIDDGPEQDDYLEVESHVLETVRGLGVPAPRVFAVDASRRRVPFAWQVLERIEARDLNQLLKADELDLPTIATQIGTAIARWQAVEPVGFGPFDPAALRAAHGEAVSAIPHSLRPSVSPSSPKDGGRERRSDRGKENVPLHGFHAAYADYFHLHLERHLHYLVDKDFLTASEADAMRQAVAAHRGLLELPRAVLVHKDLALWNILGTPTTIAAVIDWDDTIGGDPLDDVSLLACFHDATTIDRVLAGYQTIRPLPPDHRRRFWLHLLRNMLFKAVIRVGAGYFDRSDGFFLINAGGSGQSLREFTHARLILALEGLCGDAALVGL